MPPLLLYKNSAISAWLGGANDYNVTRVPAATGQSASGKFDFVNF